MLNSRICQIEGLLIDSEIKAIFVEQIKDLFKTNIPEVDLIFDFLYFRQRIAKDKPLPGQELQNIQFCTQLGEALGKREKLLYLLIIVLGRYIYNRIMLYLEVKQPNIYKKIKKLEFLFQLLRFGYSLKFIAKGQMVNTLELFLIGFQIKQIKENQTRELDFELLNRTLIWGVINKLFQSLLFSSSYLMSYCKQLFFMTSFLGTLQGENENGACFVCNSAIKTMITRVEPCKHTFCYYCSKTKIDKCPQCNQQIDQFIY
ncbi:unnamed protein product [Paramecium sonneborni]|uniref:RING-type E3 ubiquitin transferase (cysteine targeting) n=1 Tax=Paramecium sonneborni TaxID=65129 RepID=A0A8S1L9A4_9CILI|nr:unnamed protein product [Paramecium sonneborni]